MQTEYSNSHKNFKQCKLHFVGNHGITNYVSRGRICGNPPEAFGDISSLISHVMVLLIIILIYNGERYSPHPVSSDLSKQFATPLQRAFPMIQALKSSHMKSLLCGQPKKTKKGKRFNETLGIYFLVKENE